MKLKHTVICAMLASCMLIGTGCSSSSEKDTQTAETYAAQTSESEESSADTTEEAAAPDTAESKESAPETVDAAQTAPAESTVLPTEEITSTETDRVQTAEENETTETHEDAPVQLTAAHGNIGDVELQSGDLIAEFDIEGYGTIKAKLFPEIAPVGVDNFVKLAANGYYDGLNIHRVISDFMLQGGSLNGDGTGGEAADGKDFGTEISEYARHFYGALCYANAGGMNSTQFYIVNNKNPEDIAFYDISYIRETAAAYEMYKDMYTDDPVYYNYYGSMAVYYSNLADMLENASDEVIAKYKAVGGTPSLDGGYTVFGQVYEGFDVIDSISACEVRISAHDELSEPVETITITSVRVSEYAG